MMYEVAKVMNEKGVKAEVKDTHKGVCIVMTGVEMSPVFYEDDIMDIVENDPSVTPTEIAGIIMQRFMMNEIPDDVEKLRGNIENPDFVLENCSMALCKAGFYKGTDTVIEPFPIGDVDSYFYVAVGEYRAIITNALIDSLGISFSTLKKHAIKNVDRDFEAMPLGGMGFVLTNRNGRWGASSIINTEFVDKFRVLTNCKAMVVLPVSVHEVIIRPFDPDVEDKEVFDEMVRNANTEFMDTENLELSEVLDNEAWVIEF